MVWNTETSPIPPSPHSYQYHRNLPSLAAYAKGLENSPVAWQRHHSRSHVCNASAKEQLIHCKTTHTMDCDSDHLPISIQFNWEWKRAIIRKTRQWAAMDTSKLRSTVRSGMQQARALNTTAPEALDRSVTQLIRILSDAIDKSTPWNNPSPRATLGFDGECKQACIETQRLRRRWQLSRLDEDWQAYKKARNYMGRLISKHLQQAHRAKVAEAASTPKGIWKIAKWASNRQANPTATITPSLTKQDGSLEVNPKGKAELLRNSFFPPPISADLGDISDYNYPAPYQCPSITESEVERAVHRAAPNKAPGTDGITNGILQKTLDLLLPALCQLFNASWNMGYFPQHFRRSITVVLRKPGKEDYSVPKSYRPIALLNTVGKALEAVIGARPMYLADKYNLLPTMHIGGRRMASTEHAIHLLLERIHNAWKQNQVASLLLLDVSGAFDNVSHPRLLHNLRKRRIDPTTVRWISSFLSNRTTTLVLPEFTAKAIEVHTGIPQGSPLSPILYLFYNADLLEQCASRQVSTLGYIDDASLLAVGKTVQHNTQALKVAHQKAEDWAKEARFGVRNGKVYLGAFY